jgi:hypothetical protein
VKAIDPAVLAKHDDDSELKAADIDPHTIQVSDKDLK